MPVRINIWDNVRFERTLYYFIVSGTYEMLTTQLWYITITNMILYNKGSISKWVILKYDKRQKI